MKQEDILSEAIRAQDVMTSYAFAILRDWGLAQDTFQEALIIVSRKWESFDPRQDLLSWIRGIVRFQALNMLRSRQRVSCVGDEAVLDLLDREFAQHITEDAVQRAKQMEDALRSCVRELGRRARHLILGFYRNDSSGRQLASGLGMSERAVRVNLHRIRHQLRACIERRQSVEA